jgi:hypothetical protein
MRDDMTAKEYLQQYGDINRSINSKLEERRQLFILATKTTQVLTTDRVQSTQEIKIEKIVAKIVDLEKEIDEEIDQLVNLRRKILNTIIAIPDYRLRQVLIQRYIHGKKWEQIAVDLNYDYRYVLKLHGYALQEIEKRTLNDT